MPGTNVLERVAFRAISFCNETPACDNVDVVGEFVFLRVWKQASDAFTTKGAKGAPNTAVICVCFGTQIIAEHPGVAADVESQRRGDVG